jgi:hypothetical protein
MKPFREKIHRGVTLDGSEHVLSFTAGTVCAECGKKVRDEIEGDRWRGAVYCRACLCREDDHADVVERALSRGGNVLATAPGLIEAPVTLAEVEAMIAIVERRQRCRRDGSPRSCAE